MLYLITVSLLWAFSFGLIKGKLVGIDPNVISFIRIGLSFLFFLPFLRLKHFKNKGLFFDLLIIGAVQFGFMYVSYISAYQYLKAYEIALFTIFTPIYVSLIYDIINKKLDFRHFLAAILATVGAGIITYTKINSINVVSGFLLMQVSNICFAYGQVRYKAVRKENPKLKDEESFSILYLGALIVTFLFSIKEFDTINQITKDQFFVLVYLGVIASGIGFFLWNKGATIAKITTLSTFNNLKIPLAITVSLLFFNETTNIRKLIIGSAIIILGLLISKIKIKLKVF
jgi:drug/metabolite transporter (DMT)-like permease